MGSTVFPAPAAGKTRYALTLTSGTSWTVPAGVTYVNVTLQGGGGGCGAQVATRGMPGQLVTSNVATTPGAAITYAIGGGGGKSTGGKGGSGGTTTFTGATSAGGGGGGPDSTTGSNGTAAAGWDNSGMGPYNTAGNGDGSSGRVKLSCWCWRC